jgi:photosystem I subunit 3
VKRILLFVSTVLILVLSVPNLSFADTGILVDCDKSTAFTKRLNGSIKKLEVRLAKYDLDSPPALAIREQIEQTKSRFDKYRNSSLLCGTDGLPHLITDGDLKHSGEFVIPGILFLYITGWIGWSGRKYLQTILTTKNPTEKEIIIDVPLALNVMLSGYLWPTSAWNEFVSGDFIAED